MPFDPEDHLPRNVYFFFKGLQVLANTLKVKQDYLVKQTMA